jgi:ubiquinone/menaquinone biosynthesis C-methylase UbiE
MLARDVGPTDFEATGQEFLHLFIKLANLQPDERMLDIGCGCGRITLPLTGYLSQAGSYTGIDITYEPVRWCQQNITRRYSNFRFAHADLFSQRYNPTGHYQAKDYIFPFADEDFDFIFLTSVFTHLLPQDTEHYLREIARMLRKTGRTFFTCFYSMRHNKYWLIRVKMTSPLNTGQVRIVPTGRLFQKALLLTMKIFYSTSSKNVV